MSTAEPWHGTEIAIVGMVGRFPGARNLDEFWQNLRNGVESIRFPEDAELETLGVDPALLQDPQYVKASAVLSGMDLFDAGFFGYTPHEAELLDPQQRIFLECAWEGLENAGYNPAKSKEAIGVFAGATTNTYLLFNLFPNRHLLGTLDPVQVDISSGADYLATRVSYKLNLKGPGLTVQTACSTSLLAVHLACQSLLNEECDLALAGGVSINVKHPEGYQYMEGGIVSPDGHCRAFDAQARGTIFGSGVGVVVLKRLEDALAEGDTIHAVIRGSAINNDGAEKVGYTAPSVNGQANVIAQALAVAGLSADQIGYIEAHGTGTQMGDPIEIRALTKTFRQDTARKNFCAIGSVKSNIGHLAGAAGVVSLIKAVLALENHQIPPSLHFTQAGPEIDFAESPFYVNTELADWKAGSEPRRAGVSSFGVGGTNVHVILEEAPETRPGGATRAEQLLVLSAKTASALETAGTNLAEYLKNHPDLALADVAYTLQIGRSAFGQRRIWVSSDVADTIRLLEGGDPARLPGNATQVQERPVVFAFPGQGAQYVRMAYGLYQAEPVFRKWVDTCFELLRTRSGLDLRPVLYPNADPAETDDVNQTINTQPALFVIEYALAQLWMSWGLRPRAMLGHSIGEYVAACLAGVFSLEEALALVATRGRLIQSLPAGAMLAVFVPESEARSLLGTELSLAAVNGPTLCAISGPIPAIEALKKRLDAQGTDYRALTTSHAFHSSMMDPILDEFTEAVRQVSLHAPKLAYLSNVSGDWIEASQATDPVYWARHLRQAVRFSDGVQKLLGEPVLFLEVGPGDTLTKLIGSHLGSASAQATLASMRPARGAQKDTEFLMESLGRLWLAGVEVDWNAFHANEKRQRVPLPTYPFERQRYWIAAGTQAPEISPSSHKRARLADWFYTPTWKSTPLPTPFGAESLNGYQGGWLLFVDGLGLGEAIAAKLRAAGQEVVTVAAAERFARQAEGAFALDPREQADYQRLFAELGGVPARIVHLWSVTADSNTQADQGFFEETQANGFYSMMFLAQALGAQSTTQEVRLWVVSNHVQKVENADLVRPEKATILGLCRVISSEFPQIDCRHVDAGTPEKQAQVLLAELAVDGGEPVIAYRGRQRWTQTFEATPLQDHAAPLRSLRPEGAYLVTGGFSGIGLELAKYLAATIHANLLLVGRGETPEQQADAMRELEALGGRVTAIDIDYSDEERACTELADEIASCGVLRGVIHAQAVSGEKAFEFIQANDPAICELYFENKILAMRMLERALAGQALDFRVAASSLSSVLGGVGCAALAGADAFLDAFAANQDDASLQGWTSINWDAWRIEPDGGQGAGALDDLALSGSEIGLVFGRVLAASTGSRIAVSTSRLSERLSNQAASKQSQPGVQPGVGLARHPRPQLPNPYAPAQSELERTIVSLWERMLGIEEIGIDDNFFELGGNSLIAVSTIAELKKTLQQTVSVARLYQKPTVRNLAELLSQEDSLAAQRVATLAERRDKLSRRNQLLHKRKQA